MIPIRFGHYVFRWLSTVGPLVTWSVETGPKLLTCHLAGVKIMLILYVNYLPISPSTTNRRAWVLFGQCWKEFASLRSRSSDPGCCSCVNMICASQVGSSCFWVYWHWHLHIFCFMQINWLRPGPKNMQKAAAAVSQLIENKNEKKTLHKNATICGYCIGNFCVIA